MRILIVDDHQVMIDGLISLFESEDHLEVVGFARNGLQAIELSQALNPEVILMDINMPQMDGLEAITEIKKHQPHIRLLVLTMNDNPRLARRMMKNGASGVVLKKANGSKIIEAIRVVANQEEYIDNDLSLAYFGLELEEGKKSSFSKKDLLTNRELEIIKEIYKESTTKEIADKLFVSPNTVESHKSKIYSKLGIKNQVGLIKWVMNNEII